MPSTTAYRKVCNLSNKYMHENFPELDVYYNLENIEEYPFLTPFAQFIDEISVAVVSLSKEELIELYHNETPDALTNILEEVKNGSMTLDEGCQALHNHFAFKPVEAEIAGKELAKSLGGEFAKEKEKFTKLGLAALYGVHKYREGN